jgi:uncharacterized protein YybS (DUF2232 family)
LTAPQPPSPAPLVLVETAFLASASSLLWLLSAYFPGGQTLKPMLCMPLVLVYLRWGRRAGLMSVVVSSLLLLVLMGPTRSILFTIPYGLVGLQLGAFWRRGIGWGPSLLAGTLLDCMGFFLRFGLTSLLLGEDLWSLFLARASDIVGWFFDRLGILAEPNLWSVQGVAIGLLLANSFLSILITHLLGLLLFERFGGPIPRPPAWLADILEI